MKITKETLKQIIKEEIKILLEKKKKKKVTRGLPTGLMPHIDFTLTEKKKKKSRKKASAKVRNRGTVVFSAKSSKVKDDKDHFPINSEAQARNALARASQYSSVPKWYKGSLKSLVAAVQRKVKAKYKGIKTTKASKKPGKG
jgi:hypothetical protein